MIRTALALAAHTFGTMLVCVGVLLMGATVAPVAALGFGVSLVGIVVITATILVHFAGGDER